MKHALPYSNAIADVTLTVSQNFVAEYTVNNAGVTNEANKLKPSGQIQLTNMAEADRLIDEFEDPDGELMYEKGSIHLKYTQFNPFMP